MLLAARERPVALEHAIALILRTQIPARAREEADGEEMFDDDAADGKAGHDDGDADFDNGPYLRGVVVVGHVFKVDLDDVGYADYADDDVAVITIVSLSAERAQ